MADTVLIAVEGVLAAPEGSGGALRPIYEGLKVFHGLRSMYRVCLSSETEHPQRLIQWLDMNGVLATRYDKLLTRMPTDADRDLNALRIKHMLDLRSAWGLSMVVVPEPVVALQALKEGLIALLFASPTHARPEWRPDHHKGIKPWMEIAGEVARRRELQERAQVDEG